MRYFACLCGPAFFECSVCGYGDAHSLEKGTVVEPTKCPNCARAHTMKISFTTSKYLDKQIVRLQEAVGRSRATLRLIMLLEAGAYYTLARIPRVRALSRRPGRRAGVVVRVEGHRRSFLHLHRLERWAVGLVEVDRITAFSVCCVASPYCFSRTDQIPEGETPQTINLVCYSELVNQCNPGDRVIVTGTYRSAVARAVGDGS